jgi:hypothetical protein
MAYKGYYASVERTIHIMLFREIIAAFSDKYVTKYINMLCGKYSRDFLR